MAATTGSVGDGGRRASRFVAIVVDLLTNSIRTGLDNPVVYFQLCLYLASGVDLAIANKEVPSRCSELPLLLKQVYKFKKDSSFRAAFMVLMISIKGACKIGWFSNKETDDLVVLTKQVMEGFSSSVDVDIEPSCALPYISDIMCRCHPHMKMEKILVSLGVKAGFGAYVSDFNISKDMVASQSEKVWLFVIQMENTHASSHIIAPPQVNFMLNGKGVQEGIKISMDNGPQLSTNVSAMLEDGANLLQAVGNFNGNYIIALATTSPIPSSGNSELHDHDQPCVASVDSGKPAERRKIQNHRSFNNETSSRILLNCPISHCRIEIPVKGRLCKHLQCFDYQSFLTINKKEPSWRCPHCNLPVGSTELQVDQNFYKVLRETPNEAVNVIISKDGTWKTVLASGQSTQQLHPRPQASYAHSSRPWLTTQPPAAASTKGLSQTTNMASKRLKTTVMSAQDGAGRMRGSLTGEAYSAALSQFMSPPIQPAQASRPRPTVVRHFASIFPMHGPPPSTSNAPDGPQEHNLPRP